MQPTPDLPISYTGDDLGRATRGAAYGLLGKAYLQQNKYQQAADALSWLVTGEGKSVYSLVPNYQDNFKASTENNSESVFEVQFRYNPNENTDDDVDETRINNTGTVLCAKRRWVF
jgi:hypothetical protein